MSFKEQPEWLQAALAVLTFTVFAAIGAMAKIADEVKQGGRERFWSAKLWLELPTVCLMGAVAYGIVDYWELSQGPGVAVTAFLGWMGPKALDIFVINRLGMFLKRGD